VGTVRDAHRRLLLGAPRADLFHALNQRVDVPARRTVSTFHDLFVNRRKDGGLYYEEKTITPLKDDGGNITHFVSTGKDITTGANGTAGGANSSVSFTIAKAGTYHFQCVIHPNMDGTVVVTH